MDYSCQKFGPKTVFLQNTQSLVLKQQAIIAIGMDGHCCTHSKENNKAPCDNRAFKNGLFSAQFGAKTTSLFAIYTM
jgi:hypothetical protein